MNSDIDFGYDYIRITSKLLQLSLYIANCPRHTESPRKDSHRTYHSLLLCWTIAL